MSLLITGASWVIADADRVLPGAEVYVEGNRIRAVGPPAQVRRLCEDGRPEVLDAGGGVVIPGMVNAHTHLYQSCLKGRGDGLSLIPWCEQVLFPFVNRAYRLDPEAYAKLGYAWTVLGTVEMIRSGITCCIDMDLANEAVVQAWLDLGFRGVIAPQLADRWVPAHFVPDRARLEREMERWLTEWRGKGGLISVFLAPSTVFTCSPEMLRTVRRLADRHGAGCQIHVAETRWEVESCWRELGDPPLTYLEKTGFLGGHVTAVHCVHMTRAEMDLAARRGIVCVHNPKSNMRLGSGVAPVVDLLGRGVRVALGTDGAASNDLLDFFEEMRAALFLQRAVREDASALAAADVFRMATDGGAQAAGIQAGRIEEGYLADLVVVQLEAPHAAPAGDVLSALVYCGKSQDVRAVVIDGRVVMKDGKLQTVGEDVIADAVHMVEQLLGDGGIGGATCPKEVK